MPSLLFSLLLFLAADEPVPPLHAAARAGKVTAIQALLKKGTPVDVPQFDGATPLFAACDAGMLEAARVLLASGAKPAARESRLGQTPLHVAAARGHLAIVQLLLAKGAPAQAQSNSGTTALHLAARNGRMEVIAELLKAGAAADAPRKDGYSPLLMAARSGQQEAIALLVKAGANPRRTLPNQDTALHVALAVEGPRRLATVKALIEAGADPNAKNARGFSVMEIVRGRRMRDLSEYFTNLNSPTGDKKP